MEGSPLDNDGFINGYRERYTRISLFEPFVILKRKKTRDAHNKSIDMPGMGLLCLLYFFEQKLIRNTKVGARELALFLAKRTGNTYHLSPEKWLALSKEVIYVFRPEHGKQFTVKYMNWEHETEEQLTYSFIKANTFDVTTNEQFYTLDTDGLELVFATKEFYSEFQLSINQLLLRKQLEKGEFTGALRQINEMQIDVESLEERIVHLTTELKRNITSEETFQRYTTLIDDILRRLGAEHEEFQALQQFVKETKTALYYEEDATKERQAYALILQIGTRLEEVHHQHTDLLQACTQLKTSALQAAQEALYFVGIDSFNFDQDITSRIISTPLAVQSMKGLLVPFLSIEQIKVWSPLTLLAKQQLRKSHEEVEKITFPEEDLEEEEAQYQLLIRSHYTMLFRLLNDYIGTKEHITLESFITYVQQSEQEELLQLRTFYQFFLVLHQHSPIQSEVMSNDEEVHVLDGVRRLLNNREMRITERKELLHLSERFVIQNMDIQMKEVTENVI